MEFRAHACKSSQGGRRRRGKKNHGRVCAYACVSWLIRGLKFAHSPGLMKAAPSAWAGESGSRGRRVHYDGSTRESAQSRPRCRHKGKGRRGEVTPSSWREMRLSAISLHYPPPNHQPRGPCALFPFDSLSRGEAQMSPHPSTIPPTRTWLSDALTPEKMDTPEARTRLPRAGAHRPGE